MRNVLSLVWKDIVAARLVLAIALPLLVIKLWSLRVSGPAYLGVVTLSGMLFAFGSLGVEESQRTEQTWMSLPVSRTQIVIARYVAVLTGLGLVFVLGWIFNPPMLLPLLAHFFLFALGAAVFLPAYFRWGVGRALQVSGVAWIAVAAPLAFVGYTWWGPVLAIGLGAASLPLFALSGVVAARLYESRPT